MKRWEHLGVQSSAGTPVRQRLDTPLLPGVCGG